jgi:hypothetical protein
MKITSEALTNFKNIHIFFDALVFFRKMKSERYTQYTSHNGHFFFILFVKKAGHRFYVLNEKKLFETKITLKRMSAFRQVSAL